MPFDDHPIGGDGGDNPRHEGTDKYADFCMAKIVQLAMEENTCVTCLAFAIMTRCMAAIAVSDNMLTMKPDRTMEVDEDGMGRMLTRLAGDVVEEGERLLLQKRKMQ